MKQHPEPSIARIAHGAYRGIEFLVGVLAAVGSAASFLMGILVIQSISQGQPTGAAKTGLLAILVLFIPVGAWCGQIAWRLWSGRGRAGTHGLLSPTAFALFGIGLLVGVAALLADSSTRSPRGVGILLATAFAMFGMAAAQRRAERKGRRT